MLVLSMHDELIYAERLLAAGASGYIMKHAASDQLLVALRRVLAGEIYLSEVPGREPRPRSQGVGRRGRPPLGAPIPSTA